MDILERIAVPTGNICIVKGQKGLPLEFVSLGDYGKEKNIKADFLNITRKITKVEHGPLLPLTEKWVITVSTQYGCSMGCSFCDVPKVGPGINCSKKDIIDQVIAGMSLHPEISYSDRLNLHFARMGEPSWNPAVLEAAVEFKKLLDDRFKVHPVVSTMMPNKNPKIKDFINAWMTIKNDIYAGNAGLQLSINSTDEAQRQKMFNGNALSLSDISAIMKDIKPRGRKITLNFAYDNTFIIDFELLAKAFSPDNFLVKITPIHVTTTAHNNNLHTIQGYDSYSSYEDVEERSKKAGFDTIVFIPSLEEDASKITCGNAILAIEGGRYNS
jgi:23S rRNA (adenine2503-C2)-methyltransferase